MAQLVRYVAQGGEPCVGVLTDAGVHTADVASIAELLMASGPALEQVVAAAAGREPAHLREDVRLLAPVDGQTEVWGAGVTYARSRDARIEESDRADVYGLVYAADRPELFLKAAAWRVVGPGADIAVRADADDTVPEPELALVVDHAGTIVGYTICNDLTARSIEAANPLYLPQAKTYSRSCALGPGSSRLARSTTPRTSPSSCACAAATRWRFRRRPAQPRCAAGSPSSSRGSRASSTSRPGRFSPPAPASCPGCATAFCPVTWWRSRSSGSAF